MFHPTVLMMQGGDLYRTLRTHGPLGEDRTLTIAKQLVSAICYMHRYGMVHRDLKPENILLFFAPDAMTGEPDLTTVKIADYDLTQCALDPQHRWWGDHCGTLPYMAPEQLRLQVSRTTPQLFSQPVDMWALGVIVFLCCAGYHPFDPYAKANTADILGSILQNDWNFHDKAWYAVSTDMFDFIEQCMCEDPKKRLTAEQAMVRLRLCFV
jgi:serine/threonine protein kinase